MAHKRLHSVTCDWLLDYFTKRHHLERAVKSLQQNVDWMVAVRFTTRMLRLIAQLSIMTQATKISSSVDKGSPSVILNAHLWFRSEFVRWSPLPSYKYSIFYFEICKHHRRNWSLDCLSRIADGNFKGTRTTTFVCRSPKGAFLLRTSQYINVITTCHFPVISLHTLHELRMFILPSVAQYNACSLTLISGITCQDYRRGSLLEPLIAWNFHPLRAEV